MEHGLMEHGMVPARMERRAPRARRAAAWGGLLSVALLGCAPQGADAGAAAAASSAAAASAAASAATGAAPGPRRSGAQGPRPAARSWHTILGAEERRVAVVVLPGDALVEVDGQPVRRRDGIVELVGKVGEVRLVRAFKGAKSTEEKAVTIQEGGASPALVDLDEPLPRKAARAAGKGKGKPVTFGFDE